MIGICQGQTELSFALPLTERLIPTTGTHIAHPWRCRSQTLFRACAARSVSSFCICIGSTAKRDQSFICAYRTSEGRHGRLSLGNPPALKQQKQDASGGDSLRRVDR